MLVPTVPVLNVTTSAARGSPNGFHVCQSDMASSFLAALDGARLGSQGVWLDGEVSSTGSGAELRSSGVGGPETDRRPKVALAFLLGFPPPSKERLQMARKPKSYQGRHRLQDKDAVPATGCPLGQRVT